MEQNVYLFEHQKCRSSGALNELKAQTIDPKQMPLLFFSKRSVQDDRIRVSTTRLVFYSRYFAYSFISTLTEETIQN